MDKNQIIEAWKNPKLRSNLESVHPSGKGFHEMDLEEMQFVAGGSTVEPQWTPLTPLTVYTIEISVSGTISAVSGLVSYTKDCL